MSPPNIKIIDESEDWVVVDKPPGMEAHPSKPHGKVTLWHRMRELLAFELANGGQVSLITRLDRETSGLTLIAKTHTAARHLHGEMQGRRVAKEYLALVWGSPAVDEFEIDAPILRQGERLPSAIYLKRTVHPDGAAARTAFHVEQRLACAQGAVAIIRARPVTGRTHQIRVHLAHAGFPIIGDKIYGPDESCYLDFIASGWTPELAARLILPRHGLHAAALHLEGAGLRWESPLAPDLADWIARETTRLSD